MLLCELMALSLCYKSHATVVTYVRYEQRVAAHSCACVVYVCVVCSLVLQLVDMRDALRAGHAGAIYTSGQRKLPAVWAQVQGGGCSHSPGRR